MEIARAIWTAVAERSGDTAFFRPNGFQSGVALRFPPQSKNNGGTSYASPHSSQERRWHYGNKTGRDFAKSERCS